LRTKRCRLYAGVSAQSFPDGQRDVDCGFKSRAADRSLSGYADGIISRVVILMFVVEKARIEPVGPAI
jgi:hypothetical protein